MTADPLNVLEGALQDQHHALLSGDFNALKGIEVRITSALGALTSAVPTQGEGGRLADLHATARHQARLLRAALQGMTEAGNARQAGRAFTSYDSLGRAGQIGRARPRFERRS